MNAKKPAGNYGEGRLPAMAPLANPYVPFQIEGPVRYEPRKAMVRGTLYPGLDLPFMGMVNQNNLPVTPLSEVQVLAFAVQELALYLDTHPDDAEAFAMFKQFAAMEKAAKAAYESKFGPITQSSAAYGDSYRWLDGPWPWNFQQNEVK